MKYTCPVCGYNLLDEPPSDYNICECCGTEFGLDDVYVTHKQLRDRWLAAGGKWWSEDFPPPSHWSPFNQVARVGFIPVRIESHDTLQYNMKSRGMTYGPVQARNTHVPALTADLTFSL